MSEENKTNKSDDLEITLKDAASKLDISEPTVKKYLKDFDLRFDKKPGNKPFVSDEVFQALTEIVKLRANGLSIQEIKELKSQEPSKHILDEIEETQVLAKPEEVKSESIESVEPIEQSSDLSEEKEDVISEAEESDLEVPAIESEEKEEDLDDEEDEASEVPEAGDAPRRRRGFNYRYVERQISTDAKKVSSLRQRLKNTNISVQDRLYFEEALERRILFLNGWKHILRWISK